MAKWYKDDGFQSDIVLSTRVRLARNIKGIPFPNIMKEEDAKKVIALVEGALNEMNYNFTKYDLTTCDRNEKQRLVEEHYISLGMANAKIPAAVYISEDESVSIMVNEEDHIRMQCIYAGLEDKKAYDLISKIDSYLSEKLDYAIHEKYGYLTSCLTNVGTGMRISYMLHLPAIVVCGAADNIFSTIGKLGVTVRGMYGEGSKSTGYIFQISNQVTLGKTEVEIADSLNEIVNQIITKEREFRTNLSKKQGYVLQDKIMRSYGILQSARLMQSKEMLELLSNVRLGVSLGMIENTDAKTLNTLMVETAPAHIASDTVSTAIERDVERARMIRETI